MIPNRTSESTELSINKGLNTIITKDNKLKVIYKEYVVTTPVSNFDITSPLFLKLDESP